MTSREPIVVSWSGGKDSNLALHELQQSGAYEIAALLCPVSAQYQRISHHGVRVELLEAQAHALGLPLYKLELPAGPDGPCTNNVYEEIMDMPPV
jgi:diphthamide synthase (EF-2-diphthine--ammonia ligase)